MLTLRSHAVWHALPQEVLASIFKSLDFDSQLRVECVCKAWGQTMQQPHVMMLADAVLLNWCLYTKYFTIEVNKQSRALPYGYGVIGWLAKRIRRVASLHLRNDLDCTARERPTVESVLRRLLPDVSAAGLPEVALELRGSSFQDSHTHQVLCQLCKSLKSSKLQPQGLQAISHFSRLTSLHMSADHSSSLSVDCLANLTSLQQLTALDLSDFPTQLCSITSLTKLCIAPRSISAIDLSAYSQLQLLWIGPLTGALCTPIFLPCGPDVSLQTLHAASHCRLHNLASATGLTHLEAQTSHIKWMQWPTNLVKLQSLQVRHHEKVHNTRGYQNMLAEWQHYTSLQSLSLPWYKPWNTGQLPEWFTSLKQLTRLDLAEAAALNFRVCWTSISQLQHLDLCCYTAFSVQEDVLVLAEAPHLTYLSFVDTGAIKGVGRRYPEYSYVHILERLAAAIKDSNVQPSKLFRLSASRYEWQAKAPIGVPQL